MQSELGTILTYPLVDGMAYFLLSAVVGVFILAGKVSGYAALFSRGLLMAYAFQALNRVSAGNLSSYMPDISDIADLRRPAFLGFVAFLISSGPLSLLLWLHPISLPGMDQASHAPAVRSVGSQPGLSVLPSPGPESNQEGAVPEEPGAASAREYQDRLQTEELDTKPPVWLLGALVLALLWKIFYSPIALSVAAISGSALSTLNPVRGIDCIQTMGSVYWQAMAIYTGLALVQWILGLGLGFIPLLGSVAKGFVDAYALLCIGCTMGLAVFKKAPELGLE
jgi:hypothetical protein